VDTHTGTVTLKLARKTGGVLPAGVSVALELQFILQQEMGDCPMQRQNTPDDSELRSRAGTTEPPWVPFGELKSLMSGFERSIHE
jgi:hypothetical protein